MNFDTIEPLSMTDFQIKTVFYICWCKHKREPVSLPIATTSSSRSIMMSGANKSVGLVQLGCELDSQYRYFMGTKWRVGIYIAWDAEMMPPHSGWSWVVRRSLWVVVPLLSPIVTRDSLTLTGSPLSFLKPLCSQDPPTCSLLGPHPSANPSFLAHPHPFGRRLEVLDKLN